MEGILVALGKTFGVITQFPSYAMMPVIIALLALALGAEFKKAVRSGIIVGIGFIGIGMATTVFFNEVTPVSKEIVTNLGFSKEIVDVGWPVSAAIGFASDVGASIFVIGLLVNLVMLLTRTTKTIDVDIWNYWHWAFAGGLVAAVTGSFWLGALAAAIMAVATLLLGDLTAKMFQNYYGWPDISISHGGAMGIYLLQWPFVQLFKLLGWKDEAEEVNLEEVRSKVGVFGDSMMVGLFVGLALGILAQIGSGRTLLESIIAVVKVGMNAAAVMFIIPRMVAILMEGLIPVSDQARIFLEKRFKDSDREFYIGMDSALLLGDEMVLTLGIVMIPVTIALALIMPWNRMMPFGILPALPYYMVSIPPLVKGNFWKGLAVVTCQMAVTLTLGTIMASDVTLAAIASGYALPEGVDVVSGGQNVMTAILWAIFKLFK